MDGYTKTKEMLACCWHMHDCAACSYDITLLVNEKMQGSPVPELRHRLFSGAHNLTDIVVALPTGQGAEPEVAE